MNVKANASATRVHSEQSDGLRALAESDDEQEALDARVREQVRKQLLDLSGSNKPVVLGLDIQCDDMVQPEGSTKFGQVRRLGAASARGVLSALIPVQRAAQRLGLDVSGVGGALSKEQVVLLWECVVGAVFDDVLQLRLSQKKNSSSVLEKSLSGVAEHLNRYLKENMWDYVNVVHLDTVDVIEVKILLAIKAHSMTDGWSNAQKNKEANVQKLQAWAQMEHQSNEMFRQLEDVVQKWGGFMVLETLPMLVWLADCQKHCALSPMLASDWEQMVLEKKLVLEGAQGEQKSKPPGAKAL